jgi:hypothetical protein
MSAATSIESVEGITPDQQASSSSKRSFRDV